MTRSVPAAALAGLLLCAACAAPAGSPRPAPADPQAAVDGLLAADRAFSAAAARLELADALGAMFADDVVMPLPDATFAEGAEKAVAALRANPRNAGARAEWTPVRGGVSADGEHGFTFGYMTVRHADGATTPVKYLAYWVRGPEGWRVAAYKRGARPAGEVSLALMPPALPSRLVPPSRDPATLAAHRASLDAAERAFSDESQGIGLGPAFAKWGSADAVNLGRGPAFVVGAANIGRDVGEGSAGQPSPVSWGPDRVIVASSGDLGVSIGWIRRNAPRAEGSEGPAAFPFFTIWRREDASSPWRYVAE